MQLNICQRDLDEWRVEELVKILVESDWPERISNKYVVRRYCIGNGRNERGYEILPKEFDTYAFCGKPVGLNTDQTKVNAVRITNRRNPKYIGIRFCCYFIFYEGPSNVERYCKVYRKDIKYNRRMVGPRNTIQALAKLVSDWLYANEL